VVRAHKGAPERPGTEEARSGLERPGAEGCHSEERSDEESLFSPAISLSPFRACRAVAQSEGGLATP